MHLGIHKNYDKSWLWPFLVKVVTASGHTESKTPISSKFRAQILWSLCTRVSLNNFLLCSSVTHFNLLLSSALQASRGEDVINRIP